MALLTSDEAIPELRDQYRAGRLVPFIGAGYSMPLRLPSWGKLMEALSRELEFEPALFELHGTFPQLAGYFEAMHPEGRDWIAGWMRARFHSDEAEALRRESPQHRALAGLCWHTIYTTNYDRHIERALADAGCAADTVTRAGDFARRARGEACTQVVKLHGDIERPDSLVLTERHYFDRLALESAVDQRLRADLFGHSFLFMGYSFSDINIRYIWHRMQALREQEKASTPPAYLATFGVGLVQPTLLEAWNIHVIQLDPTDKTGSVARMLEALA